MTSHDIDIRSSEADNDHLIDVMKELECMASDKARGLLIDVNCEHGNMYNRQWSTRV